MDIDFVKAGIAAAGVVATGIGWYVGSRQASQLASRTEVRQRLDDTVQVIRTLSGYTHAYWTNSEVDPSKRHQKIVSDFVILRQNVKLLNKRSNAFPAESWRDFYRVATGGPFGPHGNCIDFERAQASRDEASRLEDCLEEVYIRLYAR